ncbi:MAG: hypothetical protein IRZ29_06955 [Thermoflavifilum sp.]|nr:hypothetical protein [Thermoflavifilum sp.]
MKQPSSPAIVRRLPMLRLSTQVKMAFFEAMWLTLALMLMLTAMQESPSAIHITGMLQALLFAFLMGMSSYQSFIAWHRPPEILDHSHFHQAIQYLVELGLPETLSHDMVTQAWEEEKKFLQQSESQVNFITDNHLLYRQARLEALYTFGACLAGSTLINGCYWLTGPRAAAYLSIALSVVICVALQWRDAHISMLRWLLLLIFIILATLLAGHIFSLAG